MRIKRVASWALPLIAVGGLAYLLGYSTLLSVKKIELNDVAARPDIQKIVNRPDLNLRTGAQLARVNVRGADTALMAVGWVKKASVSRNWISGGVKIFVEARVPVAKVLSAELPESSYIDLEGKIFQIDGVTADLPSVTIADSKLAGSAATFITSIPSELVAQMKELTLSSDGQFLMRLATSSGQRTIQWGSGADLAKKVEIFNRLIALPENKKITSIDLSDPKYPIVKN